MWANSSRINHNNMIRFLYKIIHYEASDDHKSNVSRSFHFIFALISTLPATLLYLTYARAVRKNSDYDLLFYGIEIFLLGCLYYLIVIRKRNIYLATSWASQYYDFGKLNIVLKILAT